MVSIIKPSSSLFSCFYHYHHYGAVGGGSTGGSSQSLNGATYTDHWSNGDPYTHNLLVHRYGIKAEQLDGF